MPRGNMSALATALTQSGKRRLCLGHACAATLSETRDTLFFDLRTPAEKVLMALKRRLVHVGRSALGLGLGVTEATGLMWLARAAQKAPAMHAPRLRALPVPQVQLDEMWRLVPRKPAQQAGTAGDSRDRSADGRPGGWIRFAPEWRLLLAAFVGPHTFSSALPLLPMPAAVVLGVPGGFREGFRGYRSARSETDHTLKPFARTGEGPSARLGLTLRELLTVKFEPIHNQSSYGCISDAFCPFFFRAPTPSPVSAPVETRGAMRVL